MTASDAHEHSPTTRARHATLAAISLGAVGVFAAVQRTIHPVRGTAFDRAVLRSARTMRRPWANAVAKALTALGGVTVQTVISVGSVVLARHSPRVAFHLGIGALGGVGAELGLKQAFMRARPRLIRPLEQTTKWSFPSGHAMASASLYLTLALVGSKTHPRARGPMLVGAGAIATSVGLSRVYRGVHWPTDVIGGLALGTAWASAVEAVFDWLDSARPLPELPATS